MDEALNTFKTLLLLCANQEERDRLLKDFMVAHHPDRFVSLSKQKHHLIFQATDFYNNAPLVFGQGRPRKICKLTNEESLFFCRCAAYLHFHRSMLYSNDKMRQTQELETARNYCRSMFALSCNESYLDEIFNLNHQINLASGLAHL